MNKKPLPNDYVDKIPERRLDDKYNAMMRIFDAAKLYSDRMRRITEADGIPSGYRMLLFHLSVGKDGMTQYELAQNAHLKPPTVSVTLQKMEKDGLVERKTNENDLRKTRVYLSEKGKQYNELVRDAHMEGDKIALSGLSAEEQKTLSELLNKVIDNLIADR